MPLETSSLSNEDVLSLASDLTGGVWRTIDDSHVYLKNGKAVAGADGVFNGKSLSEIHDTKASSHESAARDANAAADDARTKGLTHVHAAHLAESDAHLQKAGELRNAAEEHRKTEGKAKPDKSKAPKEKEEPAVDHHERLKRNIANVVNNSAIESANTPEGKMGITGLTHSKIYEKLKAAHPSITPEQFKAAASEVMKDRTKGIAGVGWSRSFDEMPKEEEALHVPWSGEKMFYMRPRAGTNPTHTNLEKAGELRNAAEEHRGKEGASAKPPLTPDALMSEFHAMHPTAGPAGVPIPDLREKVRAKYGDAAAGEHFDKTVKGLRGKQLRAVAISDRSRETPERLAKGIQGAPMSELRGGKHVDGAPGETLMYLHPHQTPAPGAKKSTFAFGDNADADAHDTKVYKDKLAKLSDKKLKERAQFQHEFTRLQTGKGITMERNAVASELASRGIKINHGLSADAIVLDASTLPVANEIPGGLEGLPTSETIDDESNIVSRKPDGSAVFAKKEIPIAYYWKEAARTPGKDKLWTHRGATQASGEAFEFPLTAEDFEDTERNFRERLAAGIVPFIPDSHVEQRDAAANNGAIIDVKRRANADGTHSLMAKMKVVGTRGQEKVLSNDVSVYLVDGNDKLVVDAYGRRQKGRVLHHLALTPNPALPHLEPFQRIAASADVADMRDVPVYQYVDRLALAIGAQTMCTPEEMAAAKEHLATMGADTSDLKPENAMAKVMDHSKMMHAKHQAAKAAMALSADAEIEPAIVKLKADLATVIGERDAAKADATEKANKVIALSAGEPGALTPWNLSAFEMNADTLREACVKSGKISSADAKMYSSIFRDGKNKPTRIALAATCDNGHPAELNFWRITANLADGIKTQNAVPRDATATDQAAALALAAEREGTGGEQEKERPEMMERMRNQLHLPHPAAAK